MSPVDEPADAGASTGAGVVSPMDEPADAASVVTTGKRRTGPASFHQRHDDALEE